MGNAWILKTHYQRTIKEMKQQFASFTPGKVSLKDKLRGNTEGNGISMWVSRRNQSCYICDHFRDNYSRYMDTFFHMYSRDDAFREKLEKSKGFCLSHFGDLCSAADQRLSDRELKEFYDKLLPLMERNMERLYEDVAWMVEKFDYQNKDADWKNSRDAIQRGMQKLKGDIPPIRPKR